MYFNNNTYAISCIQSKENTMSGRMKKTNMVVRTAMMMSMIMMMTIAFRVPIPATQGYIHLGDAMIFLAVVMLGWKYGAVAAGLGSALADLLGGYAIYAPITLIVKFIMAAAVGLFIQKALKKDMGDHAMAVMELLGMFIGGGLMVLGYYLAESFMYGSFIIPLASVTMNVLQFVVGAIIATALSRVLAPTAIGRTFVYEIRSRR